MAQLDLARWVDIPYTGEKFCRVFAGELLHAHGVPFPYVDDPALATQWARVDIPAPLDVVVFTRAGKPSHVGVCIGGGKFIHADEGQRSCIERLSSPFHKGRIEGYYRYMGGNRDA